MKAGYWMIRKIKSGSVVEKSQFYIGTRKPRGGRKKGSSSMLKKDSNMNQAVRRLARVINCNFKSGDLFITLTYNEPTYAKIEAAPNKVKAAEKEAALFWRRLSRITECSGVWVTADKDAETGSSARLHHHMIVSSRDVIVTYEGGKIKDANINGRNLSDIWGRGFVDIRIIRRQDDYSPIAAYLCRQAVSRDDAKKWHTSRGMAKPIIETERIVEKPHELRAPGGAAVKEVSHYDAESGSQYIRYVPKPSDRKIIDGWAQNEYEINQCFDGGMDE